MGRTSAPGGSRRSPRRQGSRPGHPQRARPLALDSPPLRVVGKAQPWLRVAPAEDDVRTQGGGLGIGRWPHAKVAPRPSAENFIDYADLAHVASAGVVVGYLVDEQRRSRRRTGRHRAERLRPVNRRTACGNRPGVAPRRRGGLSRSARPCLAHAGALSRSRGGR